MPRAARIRPATLFCIVTMSLGAVTAPASHAQRGDTIVVTARTPVHPGVATLVEELTLGGGSTAAEYQFTHAFLAAGRDGSVYVIDMVDPQNVGDFRSTVRRYDRTGKFVRTFGRIGQGPGEFTGGVGDVKELADGRVLLSDARGILVYSELGEPLARWNAPGPFGNTGGALLVTPGGFVYSYGAKPVPQVAGAAVRRPVPRMPIVFRFRSDGTLIDTIIPPQASFPEPIRVGRAALPFQPRPLATWSPLGDFVVANSGTYLIHQRLAETLVHAGGPPRWNGKVMTIRGSLPPIPVQDAERADWRQSLTMYNRSPASGPNAGWDWSGPDIPTVKPPLRGLVVDGEGRIWVQLHQPARLNPSVAIPAKPAMRGESYRIDAPDRWVEPMVFDVYEMTGRYLGRVRFPDGIARSARPEMRYAMQGDIVWAVLHDRDEIPTVKRYRIQWGR